MSAATSEQLPSNEKTILGHPAGLFVLFFAEMWERFNYYGMRALLVLYMTKCFIFGDEATGLGYGDDRAFGVYGAFGTLVYAFPILGGYIADRFLGYRRAVMLGGVLMAVGVFLMAIQRVDTFYIGLATLCVGNGFFKPNISSMVGKLYTEKDPRRDRGFTIFYMGINLGAFLSPLVVGVFAEKYGWNTGFMVAGIGMLLGVVVITFFARALGFVGQPPSADALSRPMWLGLRGNVGIPLVVLLSIPASYWMLINYEPTNYIFYALTAVMFLVILRIAFKNDKVTRHRIFLYVCLWFFHMSFWALFEQAGSSLTLFADRNTDRHAGWVGMFTGGGTEVPTTWFQSVNPLFIVLLGPVAAGMWLLLQRKKLEPNIPAKFGIGLVLLAFGFMVLVWGGRNYATNGLTPLSFLVMMYVLHTIGELAISPVGLSAVTKLVPPKNVGFFMGFWFLSIAFGLNIASQIAAETSVDPSWPPSQTLPVYLDVFGQGGWALLGAGVFLILISPLINKLAHGVK